MPDSGVLGGLGARIRGGGTVSRFWGVVPDVGVRCHIRGCVVPDFGCSRAFADQISIQTIYERRME